ALGARSMGVHRGRAGRREAAERRGRGGRVGSGVPGLEVLGALVADAPDPQVARVEGGAEDAVGGRIAPMQGGREGAIQRIALREGSGIARDLDATLDEEHMMLSRWGQEHVAVGVLDAQDLGFVEFDRFDSAGAASLEPLERLLGGRGLDRVVMQDFAADDEEGWHEEGTLAWSSPRGPTGGLWRALPRARGWRPGPRGRGGKHSRGRGWARGARGAWPGGAA